MTMFRDNTEIRDITEQAVNDYYKVGTSFNELSDFVRTYASDSGMFDHIVNRICEIWDSKAVAEEGVPEQEESQLLKAIAKAYKGLDLILENNVRELASEGIKICTIAHSEDDGFDRNARDIMNSWPIVEKNRENMGFDEFPTEGNEIIRFVGEVSLKDAIVITSALYLRDQKGYIGEYFTDSGEKIIINPTRFLNRDLEKEPDYEQVEISGLQKNNMLSQIQKEFDSSTTIDGKKKTVRKLIFGDFVCSEDSVMAFLYKSQLKDFGCDVQSDIISRNPEMLIIDCYISACTLIKDFYGNIKQNSEHEYSYGENDPDELNNLYRSVVQAGEYLREAKRREVENGLSTPDEGKGVYPIKFAKDVDFETAKLITLMQYIVSDEGIVVGEFTPSDGEPVVINPIRLLLRDKEETIGEIDIETLRSEQAEADKGQGLYHIYPTSTTNRNED